MIAPKPGSFEALNEAQRRAATHGRALPGGGLDAGPLLIVAGAGTGKTNTLAHRVAHLLLAGVDPSRVLMLTFTRRAAEEMVRRTRSIVAANADQRRVGLADRLAWAGTFHSLGNRILRDYARQLGLDPAFTVLDRADAADLIDVARHELGLSQKERRFPRKDACLAIYSHRVNTQGSLERTIEEQFPWVAGCEHDLTLLFRDYLARKQRHNLLDYDDLLLYWHAMMQNESLARSLATRFDHVLVDEYQDTNALQAEILRALKPDGRGVTVVGDDAQAIYSFRAATVDNILRFADGYSPRAEVVLLERNYRSVQPILDCANALMSEGSSGLRKTLVSRRPSAQKPFYVTLEDPFAQAEYVAERILAARESGVSLRAQAVLFRSAHHSDLLELELARRNIPFVKYGGLKFLEAAHVKDLLAVLRWADNPRNAICGFRVLKLLPGIGPRLAEQILARLERAAFALAALCGCVVPTAARDGFASLCEVLGRLGDPATPWPGQVGSARAWYSPQLERLYDAFSPRNGDLEQLEQIALQYSSRERFLTELTLDPPAVSGDHCRRASLDEDYVILSTVHSAKGQEWDHVYLLNVADGTFPSEFAAGKPAAIEEERRLLYVAITRARNELHLCAPLKYPVTQQPRMGDAHVYGAQSRFLTERVFASLERTAYARPVGGDAGRAAGTEPVIDVRDQLKGMW
ncbi:MAG: ATP-dependent helicase [Gammaproteobacteria bacterium]|nr:ATP-dependent helicase [Gammaproteobacteria bacterium]